MIKGILFDKDGTLMQLGDMIEGPALAIVEGVIKKAQLAPAAAQTFREKMGIVGGHVQLNSLIIAGSIEEQADAMKDVLEISLAQATQELEAAYYNYAKNLTLKNLMMEGALDLLAALSPAYHLGIVTNDHLQTTQLTLEETGMAAYIDFIACADQYPPKPDPASLKAFMDLYDLSPEEVIYVGDSYVDLQYGQHCRAAVGFDLGQGGQEYLDQADYVIQSLADLPKVLEALEKLEGERDSKNIL